MSIVKFFTDRFGRVRPITPNTEQVPQATTDQPTTNPQQNVTIVDVRKEGFKDGVLEIDKTPFESWITHSEELEVVKHELGVQRSELARLTNQLNRSETEGERLRVEIAGCTENVRLQEQFLEHNKDKIADNKKDIQALKEQTESINPAYSFIPALLFLLAGIALLAADYVVSKEIVAKGLDMGGDEAVMFALAMAMMAFAVKPAVDRIFEKNYKDENTSAKKRNHWFIGTVAILVLLSLGLLGFFRSDADSYMGAISEKQANLNSLRDQEQTPVIKNQIATLEKDVAELEKNLTDNPIKKIALVALAVMFALAGALCLSIAFPSLEARINKLTLSFKQWRKVRKLDSLTRDQSEILRKISENKSNIAKSGATINELKDVDIISEAINLLRDAISENVSKYHQIKALALTSEYRDAYFEAISYDVEGRPTIYWKEVSGLNIGHTPNSQEELQPVQTSANNGGTWYQKLLGNKSQTEVVTPQPTFAHQKLRKLIQDRKLN